MCSVPAVGCMVELKHRCFNDPLVYLYRYKVPKRILLVEFLFCISSWIESQGR